MNPLKGGEPYRKKVMALLSGEEEPLKIDVENLYKYPPEIRKKYLQIMAGKGKPVKLSELDLPPVGAMSFIKLR